VAEIRVCKKGEIAEGGTRLVKSGPVEIGVIFSKGAYYAYRNVCPHQGGPACEGLKMPQVVEKIVQGRIEKYFSEICLLEQPFVKDPDKTVRQMLGDGLTVRRFARFVLGDGA